MLRTLSVGSLLVAGAMSYLLYVDRLSPVAVTVLEWQSRLGAPLVPLMGVFGLIGLIWSYEREIRALFRPAPEPHRTPVRSVVPAGGRPSLQQAVQMEAGAHMEHDREGFPIMLVLTGMPPERARRAIDLFFGALAHEPLPGKLRIRFVGCPPSGLPRHHLVQGLVRRHLPAVSLHATLAGEDVDVFFR